jgi:hypothetical protein
MKLFRRVPLSFFTPERADELMEFAEKAQLFAAKEGNGASYLVDMFSGDEVMWDELLQESWVKQHNPLTDAKGNLDMLAATIREGGMSLRDVWDNVCWTHYQNFQKDLSRTGFHGLHFRLGINEAIDRVELVKTIAVMLYKLNPASFCSSLNALQGLSLLVDSGEVQKSYSTFTGLSKTVSLDDINLLLAGAQGANGDEYQIALQKVLRGNVSAQMGARTHLMFMIENAFVPLVYNYGYLLKSKGLSNEDVLDKASANIDALLDVLDLEAAVQSALKRQVLINLFSAFPDGLEMMSATPDELQGAFIDPVLIDHQCTRAFGYTLCGPVAVFGADQSAKKGDCRTQIVDFLSDTPYALDFELAIQGRLAKSSIIVDLFSAYCNGHSTFMDETLSGQRPEVFICEELFFHLMHRDRVKLYSDQAVLSLFVRSINFLKDNQRFSGRVFLDQGSRSLDVTFKERPHLRDDVLQLLVDNEFVTKDMFEWLGFGHRELKKLAGKAPNEVKQFVLQDQLGL